MASISKTRKGITEIYFFDGDGKRHRITLGRTSRKQAETTKLRIEQLLQDQCLGTPHDPGLMEWICGLRETMRTRLEALGLIEAAPKAITLGGLIDKFLSARQVKEGTMAAYKQATDSLIRHLGKDTPIDTITAADADAWQAAIAKGGRVKEKEGPRALARATVAKRTNIARAIFNKARLWKLLASSPFEHLKSGSQVNPTRTHFISIEDTEMILEACPDVQWRALVGIARYAGLRCPSEIRAMRWSDVDWDRKALTVRSPKTEAQADHAVRIVPVCPALQPILMELFDAAQEGAVQVVPAAQRSHANITRRFRGIVERAGLTPWPRLLQNLRASCATDWAQAHPAHECAKWLGHSPLIAATHYLQSRDLHFKAVTGSGPWISATDAASPASCACGADSGAVEGQNAGQHAAAASGTVSHDSTLTHSSKRGCASPCRTVQPRANRFNGRRGIRTPVGISQQIYSLPSLAT